MAVRAGQSLVCGFPSGGLAHDKGRGGAAGRRLKRWHGRFADRFGRVETQGHAEIYLRGLLSNLRRKNVEAIALRFAESPQGDAQEKEVVALQSFVSASPWESGEVQREIQAVFAEEFVPSASQWSLGTVGVIDESGFVKQGSESVGVAKQYCGRLGKAENCQVGVFLVGVTPAGTALLDHQLFLPADWAHNRQRRRKTHVPEDVQFQTKPEIAAEMIRRTLAAGQVRFSWIVGDELYGDSGELLDALEQIHQRYVLEVKCNTTVWVEDPAGRRSVSKGPKRRAREGGWRQAGVRSVQQIAAELPVEAWRPIKLREGSKGPLVYGVRPTAGMGRASSTVGACDLGALATFARQSQADQVPRLQRKRENLLGRVGVGGRHALARQRVLSRRQTPLGHGPLRDSRLGELASPHEPRGVGPSVRRPHQARTEAEDSRVDA